MTNLTRLLLVGLSLASCFSVSRFVSAQLSDSSTAATTGLVASTTTSAAPSQPTASLLSRIFTPQEQDLVNADSTQQLRISPFDYIERLAQAQQIGQSQSQFQLSIIRQLTQRSFEQLEPMPSSSAR